MTYERPDETDPVAAEPDRPNALLIGIGSILSVFLMAHHPSTQASGTAEAIAEIAREGRLSGLVHGGLIVVMAAILLGFLGLAARLGWPLGRVRAGALAYSLGVVAMIAAALVSGFLVPGLATAYAGRSDVEAEALRAVFGLCHQMNQVLARLGTMALSLGIFSWSLVMLARDSWARAVGVLGLAVGALPVAGLVTGLLRLHVLGMGAVILAQAVWNVGVAVWLGRRQR